VTVVRAALWWAFIGYVLLQVAEYFSGASRCFASDELAAGSSRVMQRKRQAAILWQGAVELIRWWMLDVRSTLLIGCVSAAFHDYGCLMAGDPVVVFGTVVELVKSAYRVKVQMMVMALRTVKYLGVRKDVHLPKTDPIVHPVSYFTRGLYTMFAPERAALAFSTYKRVNPTGELKLEQLKKFDDPMHVPDGTYDDLFIALAEEYAPWTDPEFCLELQACLLNWRSFDDVTFEGSSAAGYPFKAGTKRRNVFSQASAMAVDILERVFMGEAVSSVLSGYLHYATGRAKLMAPTDPDSCRLVTYQSFATFLVMQKYASPFTKVFVRMRPSWSAVGFSWFHRGANKLAMSLGLVRGRAPAGCVVASLDASNWDASLARALIMGACKFHLHVLRRTVGDELALLWEPVIVGMYEHMIQADVAFPGGHVFRLPAGMKSGWNLTSIDNTIIHEVIFRQVSISLFERIVPHQLYGDDNIFVAPESVTEFAVSAAYAVFGIKVKYLHTSRASSGVDFLSKFLYYDSEHDFYYPYRATVESDARILMPEDFDPALVPAADAVAAAEVVMGHLFDNFFNEDVRELCHSMLLYIRDTYDVQEVDPGRGMRGFRHRGFHDAFRTALPTVPDLKAIFNLYEAPHGLRTRAAAADATLTPPRFDWWKRAADATAAVVTEGYARIVQVSAARLGVKSQALLRRLIRPFVISPYTLGTAGGKALEAMKVAGLRKPSRILDVGGHPGSVATACQHACPDVAIVTVSKRYDADVKAQKDFMYKAHARPQDVRIEGDFATSRVVGPFDYAHIDVTFEDTDRFVKYGDVGSAGVFLNRLTPMVERALDCSNVVGIVLPSLVDTFAPLVHTLTRRGEVHVFKPQHSYPWNTEAVVVVNQTMPPMNLRMSAVRGALRAYRIGASLRLASWSVVKLLAVTDMLAGRTVHSHHLQRDGRWQLEMLRKVLPAWARDPTYYGYFSDVV